MSACEFISLDPAITYINIKGSLLAHLLVSPLYLTSIVVGGGDGGFDLAAYERAFYGRYPSGSRLRVYFLTLLLHNYLGLTAGQPASLPAVPDQHCGGRRGWWF
jgi:hypothetical protein